MSILLYGLSSKREKKIIGNATTKATLTVLANLVKVTGWPDQNRESDHDGQICLKIGKKAEKNRAQNYERYFLTIYKKPSIIHSLTCPKSWAK